MMEQIQSMKAKIDETKEKLDHVIIEGDAGSGAVKVQVTGNKVIKHVLIDKMLYESDKEELEDLLVIALNRAMEKAEKVYEEEMKGTAQSIMPGLI